MTEPNRNTEIAIARAFYETRVRMDLEPENALTWEGLPIENRTKLANTVNSLIIQGVITPGFKVTS